jgi:hypothetical protein
MTVFGNYNGEEITARFSALTEPSDYGVPGSPSWDEVVYTSVRIESLEMLGREINVDDLPKQLRSAVMDLSDEVEFERED